MDNVPTWGVGEFTSHFRQHVERGFSRIRIRGELRGVLYHTSGHLYAQLREDDQVLDVVCWRGKVRNLSLTVEDGMEIVATGALVIYGGRSRYQLVIDSLELAGEGALLKMLKDRKSRLAKEGLFAQESKQKLPLLPEVVGVITSPLSAAMHDIAKRARERLGIHLLIWPAAMQGVAAVGDVVAGIEGFHQEIPGIKGVGVIIIARGGGSLEDLLPFSDEKMVRAVAKSKIPVVSAIGHESDECLLDDVADLRVATPTAAIEAVVPERKALENNLRYCKERKQSWVTSIFTESRQRYELSDSIAKMVEGKLLSVTEVVDKWREKTWRLAGTKLMESERRLSLIRIQTPERTLAQKQELFQKSQEKLQNQLKDGWGRLRHRFDRQQLLWERLRPDLRQLKQRLYEVFKQLQTQKTALILAKEQSFVSLGRLLENFDEKAVLRRGYVLVRGKNNVILTHKAKAQGEREISLQFFDGNLVANLKNDDKKVTGHVKKSGQDEKGQGSLI